MSLATPVSTIPAFKEWSLVCDAMGEGKQAVILRKGGIAEGRAGFAFKHGAFLLFPTLYHAQRDRLRPEFLAELAAAGRPEAIGDRDGDPDAITFTLHAAMTDTAIIDRWEAAAALAPLHGWNDDIIRERFDYAGDRRLHLALVRVSRLAEAWTVPYEKRYGGCRSWVEVPSPPAELLESKSPVLDDDEYASLRATLLDLLGRHGCRLEPADA